MKWASVPAPGLPDLVLLDGDCVLCSAWARFIHRRDRAPRFRFAAIQSEAGRALAQRFGVDPDTPETNIVVVDEVAHFKSASALAVLGALPGWGWSRALLHAPMKLRDWVYDRVARNRYRLFGRRAACVTSDPSLRARLAERIEDLSG